MTEIIDDEIPLQLRRQSLPPMTLRNRVLADCVREQDDAWPWWQVLAAVFILGLFLAAIAQPDSGHHSDNDLAMRDDRATIAHLLKQEF